MAQETWAAKMDGDLKSKVQEIIKNNFESSQDFMERVIDLYKLDQLKEGSNIFRTEIEELEALTKRINGVFINANEKINNILIDKDNQAIANVALKEKLIENLQGKIDEIEQEKEQLSTINDSLYNTNQEYKEEVNQLTKSNSTLEELVKEYKEKNDMLTGLLAEYKADHEEVKTLNRIVNDKEQEVKQLELEMARCNRALDEAQKAFEHEQERQKEKDVRHENSLKELKTKHQEEVAAIKIKYEEEMAATRTKCEIEAKLQVLEIQKESHAKLQTLQDRYSKEVEEYQAKSREMQDKHNKEVEEYQTKYKALLEQLKNNKTDLKKITK